MKPGDRVLILVLNSPLPYYLILVRFIYSLVDSQKHVAKERSYLDTVPVCGCFICSINKVLLVRTKPIL